MLNKAEQELLEALDSMLQHDVKLGLQHHDLETSGKTERGLEYLHGQIEDMFAHKATDLVHYDGIRAAFAKVHSYKYLNDPTFKTALDAELRSQAVPAPERDQVATYLDAILDDLQGSAGDWAERDFGFHPELDEVMEIPNEADQEWAIHDTDLNDGNLEAEPKIRVD